MAIDAPKSLITDCTPNSVQRLATPGGSFILCGPLCASTLSGEGRAVLNACLALLRAGFAMLPPLFFVRKNWGGTVRSYRTFSPLPEALRPPAVYFLLHFPWLRDVALNPRPMVPPIFSPRKQWGDFGPAPCRMEFGSSSPPPPSGKAFTTSCRMVGERRPSVRDQKIKVQSLLIA